MSPIQFSRSRGAAVWGLLIAVLAAPPAVPAQQQEAPVRYEDDFLSADFHRSRRELLRERLPDNAVAIVFSAATRNRSNDVSYEYRQSSDLLYLTGSEEAGSVLLLSPGGIRVDGRTAREVLFVPPRDPAEEVWTGRRYGTERAMSDLGLELAVETTRFDEIVAPILRDRTKQIHHVEMPDAPESGSELARQLEIFLEHVRPLTVSPEAAAAPVVLTLLAGPEAYDRLKQA